MGLAAAEIEPRSPNGNGTEPPEIEGKPSWRIRLRAILERAIGPNARSFDREEMFERFFKAAMRDRELFEEVAIPTFRDACRATMAAWFTERRRVSLSAASGDHDSAAKIKRYARGRVITSMMIYPLEGGKILRDATWEDLHADLAERRNRIRPETDRIEWLEKIARRLRGSNKTVGGALTEADLDRLWREVTQ